MISGFGTALITAPRVQSLFVSRTLSTRGVQSVGQTGLLGRLSEGTQVVFETHVKELDSVKNQRSIRRLRKWMQVRGHAL